MTIPRAKRPGPSSADSRTASDGGSLGTNEKITELYRIIANLESAEDCALLFDDLCTNPAVDQMAERPYAATLPMEC